MIAPGSLRWQIWYSDTFDREARDSVDDEGVGLVSGLRSLWKRTLHEGVSRDGQRTFSAFSLVWREGEVRRWVTIPLPATGAAPVLAKLRAWVFPVLPVAGEGDDGCATAPHGCDDAVVDALAKFHCEAILERAPDGDASAARVLEAVASADGPEALCRAR